jgi:hypothetical protein
MSEPCQRIINTDVRSERIINTEPYSPRSGEVLIRRAGGTPMSAERR